MKTKKVLNIELLDVSYHKYAQQPEEYIIEQMGSDCSFEKDQIRMLIQSIGEAYHGEEQGVYYHNITHAFDVATTTDRIIIKTNLIQKLTISQDQRILYLIAAYAHDVGHEGLTNNYYIKKNKNLAIIYNYNSPLENMHASKLMRLIQEHRLSISLPMKRRIVAMILATDNAHHHEKIDMLLAIPKQAPLKNYQQLILGSVVHAADIGNPIKDMDMFNKWGELINMEFQRQNSIETHTPTTKITQSEKIAQQINFIQNFTHPFYIQLQIILPELTQYTKRIQQNMETLLAKKKNE